MIGKPIELFKLLGFSVKVDFSWLFIAVLVTWTLAVGLFPYLYPPQEHPQFGTPTFLNVGVVYWLMGLAGMFGMFASIVLHELGHSLVARRQGIQMKGITLFIFGGVAEMTEEPPSAKAEFWMAIAGPIVSVMISVACYGLYRLGDAWNWPVPVTGVLWYISIINAVLVAFNLIPAFPLDGGRVLRSLLWQFHGSLKRATQITATLGSGFGLFMIVWGVLRLIGGDFLGGIWSGLLGMFLRAAAQSSYQQLLVRRALQGEPVERFMTTDVKTVSPDVNLQKLVDDYVYHYHFKMFPVVDGDQLLGCVTTRRIRQIPRDEWGRHTVREITDACTEQNTIEFGADALQALTRMTKNHASRLMVVENGQLRGLISLKDMLQFISLKVELELDET